MSRVPLSWCVIVLTFAGVAFWLLAVGRPALCPCGTPRLWGGDLASPESSQQLSDWLTLFPFLRGLLTYWVLSPTRRMAFSWRLAFAILFAGLWEVAENSATALELYLPWQLAPEQAGDSVINALGDMLALGIGFWLAAQLPVKASIGLFLAVEILLLWVIRDSLMLRALMWAYPLAVLRDWQAG
ncbi:MAG: DUF2585 family protein [Rhodobacteraceae bacterium]|nr:DUF2585 family protein [Paracoccaceae bacterium]